MDSQISIIVPSDTIFAGIEKNVQSMQDALKGIGVKDGVLWCARILRIVTLPIYGDIKESQRECVRLIFDEEQLNHLQQFDKENKKYFVTVFFRGQLLEVFRWVLVLCDPDKPIVTDKKELSIAKANFLKAVLLGGDFWSERSLVGMNKDVADIEGTRRSSLIQFRRSREAGSSVTQVYQPIARAWAIFSSLFPKHHNGFDEEFFSITGLQYKTFFNCQLLLWAELINRSNSIGSFSPTDLTNHPYSRSLQLFFDIQSQTFTQLKSALWPFPATPSPDTAYRYRPIRERPIAISDDRKIGVVIDPLIFAESIQAGPLFLLLRGNADSGFLFGSFGKAFEEYACGILRRMYPERGPLRRLSTNINGHGSDGQEFEVDACLNNVTEIVLFEIKASFLSEEKIICGDHEEFLEYLSTRYAAIDPKRPKGVGQLARIAKYIAEKKWMGQNDELSEVKRIYPVIVVNDNYMDIGLFGNFLAKEFARCAGVEYRADSDEFVIDGTFVKHLILLTVDDLENLESSIEKFSLLDLLESYSVRNSERLMSLHNFIYYSEFSNKMRHNQKLLGIARDLMAEAKKQIFGP